MDVIVVFFNQIKMVFWNPGQLLAIFLVIIIMLVSAWIFFRKSIVRCDSKTDLIGKTAIVTGANCGKNAK